MKTVWLVAGLCCSLSVGVLASTLSDVTADKIDRRYRELKSLRAEVTQTIVSERFGDPETFRGTLRIQIPGKVRWDYRGTKKAMVINGQQAWISDPQDRQILEGQGDFQGSWLGLLSGETKLREQFTVVAAKQQGQATVLTLVPKAENTGVREIELNYNEKLQVIDHLEIIDSFGNKNVVSLHQIKFNVPIAAELFAWKVPKGYTVIKPTLPVR